MLTLVRVDDRLIHGQVVAIWLKELPATRIVVIDDPTARDEFLTEVIELAAPPGVAVEVHSLALGIERLRGVAGDREPTYVLLRSPYTALALRRAGIEFPVLNVGGMGIGPRRQRLHRSISASQEELDAMRQLEALGTKVELRTVPGERAVSLDSVHIGP